MYNTIRKRVLTEILEPRGMTSGRGGYLLNIETCFILSLATFTGYCYIMNPSVLTGIALGAMGVWIGVGVQHTANHGVCLLYMHYITISFYSKKKMFICIYS